MAYRSGRNGRSWYRLSSIVRPTPYSSRDPSPPPPPSPPLQPMSPPLTPPSPHEVQEAKPSSVQSPWHISKHDPTKPRDEHGQNPHQKSAEKTPMLPREVQEAKPSSVQLPRSILKHDPHKPRDEHESAHQKNVPPQRMSPPKKVQETKPSSVQLPRSILKHEPTKPRQDHDHESTHQKNLPAEKTPQAPQRMSPPKAVQEAKVDPVQSPRSILKHDPPNSRQEHESAHQKNVLTLSEKTPLVPQPLFPPKEVQEARPSTISLPRSTLKHDEPPKPRHERENTHQKNVLMLSDKTNLVHESSKERQQREYDEVTMRTQSFIHEPNEEHQQQQQSEFDDFINSTQSAITISGENKGAMMEILRPQSKTYGDGKGRRLDEYEEKKSKSKSKSKSKNRSKNDGNHFVNSNVQIINGSVVYNSTETHYDPGVHLSLCRKPCSDNGFIIKDHERNGYTSSIN